jgi:hypothetical protein
VKKLMTKNKNTNHTQCLLQRKIFPGVEVVQTSWIPEGYAVKGKFIKLKDKEGNWEDGWEVIEVFDTLPSKYVEERAKDYRTQRQGSDI